MTDDVFTEYSNTKDAAEQKGLDAFDDYVDRGKEVKCPNCGGNMEFDPETQGLKCSHCGTKLDIEERVKANEIGIEQAFKHAEKWDKAVVVRCENCGAKIVIEANEVAKKCPYCGTSQIKKSDEMVGLKPNAVYPFTVSKAQAELLAKKWARRKLFAPRKFKKTIEANNFHGVYEPGFTFDSATSSTYEGTIGETRTRTVGSGKDRHTETYIHWKHVKGSIEHDFDDVTISASNGDVERIFSKLQPYPIDNIKAYEKKYLAGFKANHYQKDIKTCWQEAKSVMDGAIRKMILSRYDCDVVEYLNVWTTHEDVTYKYVLYPVYRLNYHFKKKDYNVSVNGETGKVYGKTPVSPVRVVIAVVLAALAVVGLLLLVTGGDLTNLIDFFTS
ncbi:MAG: zinc ribbon domain-containing protein [Clostridia bacterium]|nr:zinc ribbon domain-containing protein [Clostridia bacterium]